MHELQTHVATQCMLCDHFCYDERNKAAVLNPAASPPADDWADTKRASTTEHLMQDVEATPRKGKANPELERVLDWRGALGLGLGSMLGTGVFVSLALAAGIAGPWALPALIAAAFVALANAFSSAQLAAAHPVSGGTYEYGYTFVHPWI